MSPVSQTSTAEPLAIGLAVVGTYGLAHSLLAWARCRVWCDEHGVPMMAPNWLHLEHRIGPLLRRERDARHYHRLFDCSGYITGFERLRLLLTREKVEAIDFDIHTATPARRPPLVVFRNLMTQNDETHFHEIVGKQSSVQAALEKMTRAPFRPPKSMTPHIAVHVRLGDFRRDTPESSLRRGARNSRLPLGWYTEILAGLRVRLGDLRILVYSDGQDRELAPLLRLPNVSRSHARAAVTDLLSMSRADLIVSSGSGFSLWGAYLGHVPRICYPGQRYVRAHGPPEDDLDTEPECEDGSAIPQALVEHVRRSMHLRAAH